MAQPTISLFIDVQNRQLIRGFTNSTPAILPVVYQGDTVTLAMRFMQATGVSSAPYTDLDYSAAAVTVAVGEIGAVPTSGTFTLTDTSATQTTAALPYNATAQQVQSAVQAALTSHWSTATVLGNAGGPYTITNGVNGVQTALIGSSHTLSPASSIVITPTQVGTDSLPDVQYARLTLNPIALQNTWTASFSPDVLTGNLSLDTASIEEVIGNLPSICTTLSIQVIPVGGEAFTVYQRNFTIENDLIDGAPSIPTPAVSYYTTVQSDARYKGTGIYVERNSTGDADLHITTTDAGSNNIIFLITNAPSTVNFTFDNGTFDGQTVTWYMGTNLNPPEVNLTYSDNVVGIAGYGSYGDGATLSFIWDAANTVWIPI